ncbi:MAG: OmpA family protein [Bdellovibrionales bacterium]|nr:OmpA family protein [Bdellovibrionales bacterium]
MHFLIDCKNLMSIIAPDMKHFMGLGFHRLVLVTMVLATCRVRAQEVVTIDPYDHMRQTPWVFIGTDLGYGFLSTNPLTELTKHGVHGDFKGLFSNYWRKWVVDTGAGWMVNWLAGGSDNSVLTDDKVTTLAALLELSGRYRLTQNWEVGLQNQLFLGTDTTFSTTGAENEHVSYFLGPQVAYTIASRNPWRLTGAFWTDVNVPNRQLYLFMLGIQWGLPVKPIVRALFERSYEDPIVIVSFDLDTIHFEFDKHVLSPRSKDILWALGEFLAHESKSWRYLRIEGHADNRGSDEYNQQLSERRAMAVKQAIVEKGVMEERIEVIGYGESRPKIPEDSEYAWAKNRRVELIFDRVKDPKKFKKAIDEIRERFGQPELFPYTKKPTTE